MKPKLAPELVPDRRDNNTLREIWYRLNRTRVPVPLEVVDPLALSRVTRARAIGRAVVVPVVGEALGGNQTLGISAFL